ncbi:MAG: sodium/proline symporter PutP [Clostridiales bacterium]|nr:sodium/proline symporter PutP [Clostridiales bacterium]
MTLELLAFILYLVLMLSVGMLFFFKSRGAANGAKSYFLGGRSMGPYVTAMSAQASDMSGWLLMGFPAIILAFVFVKVWICIGLALGTALNWILVAKRLRNFSAAADDAITIPQYLSNRFASKNPALRIICAIIFLIFFTVYVASSFKAGGTLFAKVIPQLSSSTAMLIFAGIIIVYTFFGGFKAVCWTDFFQGLMMLIAMLAVPIVIVATQELDFSAINVAATGESLIGTDYEFVLNPFKSSWKDIVSGLAWGLGYFGMPHILVRFMSIKKASLIKKSATVAIIWVVLSLGAAVVIACFGRVILPELITNGEQENVFIDLVRMLFPSFIAGILLSAILAAAMSTADSQLLVASSSFTSDIYKPVFRKNASDKEVLWVGRAVVAIISVIAYFIARNPGATTIMGLVENAWAGFGAAFGPVIILSLFWKRFTYKGAVAGIVGGGLTVILWIIFLSESSGIYELLPGFAVCLVLCIAVSLIDKAPSQEVLDIFEKATSKDFEEQVENT